MAWSTESRHARGYGTAWTKLRAQVMQRDMGLCQCDKCQGGKLRVMAATDCDHIVSKAQAKAMGWTQEQTDDMSNLRAVSKECHQRITQEQQGRTQRAPRARFGKDGRVIW
jgi:5-methylcytosine-specific restriction protein A